MSQKTRLDVVVTLRERDEDRARRELAEAQRQALSAEKKLQDAADKARQDERKRGRAVDWEIVESAHNRALHEARLAEKAVVVASEQLGSSRQRYLGAYGRAEAIRRVVEARRSEMVRQADSAERKADDELATLRFAWR